MSALQHSALYLGQVGHRRFAPRAHAFNYAIGLFYLDLDELPQLLQLSRCLGSQRWRPLAFREQDYLSGLTGSGLSLREAVRQRLHEALGRDIDGPVRLLTQLRCWGLSFNPASFFYCFDRQEQLQAILVEVSNTPWRERYHYVLPAQGDGPQFFAVAKCFHVSPYLPREVDYHMHFSPPGQRLGIHMADWQGPLKLFDASLSLRREPLDQRSLHRYLRHFPWMTGKAVLGIYWQALRLLLKRTPIHDHQPALGQFQVAQFRHKESADENL